MLKVLAVAVLLWAWLLIGFVSNGTLFALGIVGPLLLVSGLALVRFAPRTLARPGLAVLSLVAGLCLVAGSAATLLPAAPASRLTSSTIGWDILARRTDRADAALGRGWAWVLRRLVGRGLGTDVPRDSSGVPLVHRATTPDLLAALLDGGLDPDARDDAGRTLLTRTSDADMIRLLLAAGADVDAVDDEGFTVADFMPEGSPLRALVEAHAGRPIRERAVDAAVPRGRTNWLTGPADSGDDALRPTIGVEPAGIQRGGTATVSITFANGSPSDQWLDVTARLSPTTLFVGASHDGAIARRDGPVALQTIRWPVLELSAGQQGQLALQVVLRSDDRASELGVEWQVRRRPDRGEANVPVTRPLAARASRNVQPDPPDRRLGYAAAIGIVALLVFALRRWKATSGTSRVVSTLTTGAAAVCGLAAGAFLWSSVEPVARFEETTCTILDHRVHTYPPAARSSSTGQRATRNIVEPIAAVQVERGAGPIITTGFTLDAADRSPQALRAFPLGSRVPCWVDPTQPSRFTLVRTPAFGRVLAVSVFSGLALVLLGISYAMSGSAQTRPPRSRRNRRDARD